jgi:U3 small nucleolar RNA-associated protein 4
VNPASTQLALGCEDGTIRLLSLEHDTLSHLRRFDRAKCRLLSIAWGPPVLPAAKPRPQAMTSNDDSEEEDIEWTDEWIVTGGSDSAIRRWDVKTGRVTERMTTDKARGERTLVWAVAALALVFSSVIIR